jgi:AraC family transcriptional regulator
MQPRIETMHARKLVGIRQEMSLAENRTAQLWRSFMPRRHEVKNRITNEYISIMESYSLPGGQYAVFIHNGPASAAPKTMQHIFGTWLPASEYELDSREHFEILPEGYDPFDKHAQEEVWIPIR